VVEAEASTRSKTVAKGVARFFAGDERREEIRELAARRMRAALLRSPWCEISSRQRSASAAE
jgi:hypothetical protein